MEKMSRSGQDVTIAIIITVIVFLGSAFAFYQYVYKVKLDEIASLKTQRTSKEQTFTSYKAVIEEKLNYEDQLTALNKTWVDNKHYFVNGLVDWNNTEEVRQTQFTIFQLYEKIMGAGAFAGIEMDHPVKQPFKITFDYQLKFHPDDEPFDFPPRFLNLAEGWEFVPSERFPQGGEQPEAPADTGGAAGGAPAGGVGGFNTGNDQGGAASTASSGTLNLFNAHDFTVEFEATYDQLKRFIEILQDLEGEETWLVSIHCFEAKGDPLFFGFPATLRGQTVYTDVKIPMSVFCTAYELYEPGATNTPPNLPGETSCSATGGGGGGGGTGGGGMGAGGGGGAGGAGFGGSS